METPASAALCRCGTPCDDARFVSCAACRKDSAERSKLRQLRMHRHDANGRRVCPVGHPIKFMSNGKGHCPACRSELAQRRAAEERRKREARIAKAVRFTWEDYADAVDRDFALPHWLRRAPAIKDWLLRHRVRPGQ